ncbi:MAG: MMPL family transporter [Actinomycetes bacterium]
MLAALGRLVCRHPVLILLAWLGVVTGSAGAAFGAFGNEALFGRLTSGEPAVPGEALDGRELLDERSDTGPSLTLLLDGVDPDSPAVAQALAEVAADLGEIDGVASVVAPVAPLGAPAGTPPSAVPELAPLIAEDGAAVLVTATLEGELTAAEEDAALEAVAERMREVPSGVPGARARVGGVTTLVDEITEQVETDLRTGEGIALPVSLLVMIFVFGGFLAAGMPIAGAITSILTGLGALLGWSHVLDLDASVVNVVTVLGLGLCIDYGLLVVSRYREELRASAHRPGSRAGRDAALVTALSTAGRTVTFSAVTVAISLMGLLAFRADILRAVGAAAMSIVVVALAVALVLVPTLIVLAGDRLARPGVAAHVPGLRTVARRFGDVAPEEGRFSRLARWVQRHAAAVLVAVTALLLLLGAPALQMVLRTDGVELLPTSSEQRQFFTELESRFPASAGPDVTVVADASVTEVAAWAQDVAALDGVESVDAPETRGDLTVLGVRTEGDDALGEQARDVVQALRADRPDFDTWVTGQAAGLVDFTADLRERTPVAVLSVVAATFVLLFLLTGSVLVPLKALLMNLVSLGASLGILVWVFQWGNLESLLGFSSTGGIEAFVPALAVAFGFGLAMDYEVFLLSRIVEERQHGASNDLAVERGLQRSGRIITSAALIIVIVFLGFVAGQLLIVKEVGVALAVAVAVDATLVRMLLVPATMTLLGEWNWWAPKPLRRLHSRFGIRE